MVPRSTVLIHFLQKIRLLDINDRKGNIIRIEKTEKIKVSFFHINIIYLFRPTLEINNSYGPLSMLFRTLMPNFNLDVILQANIFIFLELLFLEFSCPC